MIRDRHFRLSVAVELLSALCVFAQGGYKVESVGSPAASDLPQATRQALEPQGARLASDQGAPVAEVWLHKSIPTQQASGSADVVYPGMIVGTMVGVARFPNGGSDFRGQPIKPGYYTLRYAQMPQDGNHMGVSPYRDFLLLAPAAVDTEIDKPLAFDALLKLSRQASGTGHPAVLSLSPATASKPPTAYKDDQGHWVLQVPATSAGGQPGFPIGIVLVGKSEAT